MMAKKRVLLIEDNNNICDIVRWVLEEEDYTIQVTGQVPMAQLVNMKADLIVLDEWVNKKEGHMLCKEIKKIKAFKHVPVIIFSTALDIEEIVKSCGADGYVRKPFDINALFAEVNRLLHPDSESVGFF